MASFLWDLLVTYEPRLDPNMDNHVPIVYYSQVIAHQWQEELMRALDITFVDVYDHSYLSRKWYPLSEEFNTTRRCIMCHIHTTADR
eukprot:Nitzschia sp. Nitz4//scaffold177_size45885//29913//30326//NITZ4_007208-RA/size45885-exonerate_est2genome-gene-0.48-mRNA-1//-1//CDS//3329539064//2934//frame0